MESALSWHFFPFIYNNTQNKDDDDGYNARINYPFLTFYIFHLSIGTIIYVTLYTRITGIYTRIQHTKVKVPIMEQICKKIFCASDSERIKAKGKI